MQLIYVCLSYKHCFCNKKETFHAVFAYSYIRPSDSIRQRITFLLKIVQHQMKQLKNNY